MQGLYYCKKRYPQLNSVCECSVSHVRVCGQCSHHCHFKIYWNQDISVGIVTWLWCGLSRVRFLATGFPFFKMF